MSAYSNPQPDPDDPAISRFKAAILGRGASGTLLWFLILTGIIIALTLIANRCDDDDDGGTQAVATEEPADEPAEPADEPEPEVEAPEATEPATDPFAEMSEPEAAADVEPVESTDWVGGADDAPTFEPEAELEAIFATDPEPVPENTGEALFDSLQDDAPDPASVFDEVAEAADDAAEEAPVVEVPEPDSMVSVRKGLFGR